MFSNDNISRRRALGTLAGGTFCGLCAPAFADTHQGRIDIHHHFAPPAYGAFFTANGHGAGAPPSTWNLTNDLHNMSEGGTRMAVLSLFTPYDVGTAEARRNLAREINLFGARAVVDHPAKFRLFASLPLPDIEGSLYEIEYGLDTLKAVGVAVYTNVGDKWLGDPIFSPIWEELNRRRAVVFVHPTSANCCRNLVRDVPDPVIEYGADTTRTIASLIFSGTTTRFPNIRFVFSHGGGAMPFVIERFLGGTQAEIVPGILTEGQTPPYTPSQPPGGALRELRKLYYDTAQANNPVALQALRTVVPVSQILYGTDYWYRSAGVAIHGLETAKVFSTEELKAVEWQNALKLIG